MAHLTDIDVTAPAHSLYSGGVVLNAWRARIDVLNDALGDITSVEADQIEAIGTTTISAAQWAYVGALNQGLTTTSTVTFGTINAFTLGGKLTAGAVEIEGSAFDINGGTIDGITSLTAAGALDIGAYGFRAATLTADGLTATRVVFAGANGLLSDAAAMTFITDTLTVTKLGAFQAAGAINFDSQNMTNVDIDSGTIDGITDLAVADGGTGSSTAANARTALGVAIGSNVLAYDAGLSNLAGIAMVANKFYYTSGDNTHVAGDVTVFARTILDDADADTVLGTLGLSTNLPNLVDAEVTQLEAIGAATISGAQWGYLGACGAGGGQLLAALTTGESTQLEAIGATTISLAQWGWLGGIVVWDDWTPTYGASGSMTYTSVTTLTARYCQIGKVVYFNLNCHGTTGGSAGTSLNFTLPSAPAGGTVSCSGACHVYDTTDLVGIFGNSVAANQIDVSKYDFSNWGLGASKYILIQGFYEVA